MSPYPLWSIINAPWDKGDTATEDVSTNEKVKEECILCDKEMCEALDAYYGESALEKSMCANCQLGRTPKDPDEITK
jgi:hypothetical protein